MTVLDKLSVIQIEQPDTWPQGPEATVVKVIVPVIDTTRQAAVDAAEARAEEMIEALDVESIGGLPEALAGTKDYTDGEIEAVKGGAAPGRDTLKEISDALDALDAAKMPKAGGAFTGPVELHDDPVEDLEAAPKQYVDRLNNSILGHGAKVDGVTDDSAAIAAMYASEGYVRLPAGSTYLGDDVSVDGTVTFEPGAYITGTGVLSFKDVTAGREYIFRGAAPMSLTPSYVTTSPLYPEWWGWAGDGASHSSAIEDMLDSIAPRGEFTIEFGYDGVYFVDSPITWPRGTFLKFPGETRRGIFKLDVAALAGADVFTCSDDAFRMEGVQVELSSGTYYAGRIFTLTGINAQVDNASLPAARVGISVSGATSRVSNIRSEGTPTESNFSTVVVAGSGVSVTRVTGPQYGSSYAGAVVSIGRGMSSGSAANIIVDGVYGMGAGGRVVELIADGSTFIAGVTIGSVIARDGGGGVLLKNTGSSSIQYVTTGAAKIGSGNASAVGVAIEATAGINNISVGPVDMRQGATCISIADATNLGKLDLAGPLHGGTAKFTVGTGTIANLALTGRKQIGLDGTGSLAGNTDRTLGILSDQRINVLTGTLTANRTITLPTTCPFERAESNLRLVNQATVGAYTIAVGSLATLTGKGWVDLHWVGSAWAVTGYGGSVTIT